MTIKKEQTRSGATELKEEDLDKAEGGYSWGASYAEKMRPNPGLNTRTQKFQKVR